MTVAEAIQFGWQHQQAGRLREAEELYRQVLAVDGENVDALHLLGLVAASVGQHAAAIELIEKAIRAHPGVAELFANLAVVQRQAGRLRESVEPARRAMALKPGWVLPYSLLAAALAELGELNEAEGLWNRAIELEPGSSEIHANLGVTYERLGRLEEAAAYARRAIELKNDNAMAHMNLGCALLKLGRPGEAIEWHRRAIALRPQMAVAYVNLSLACIESGQLEEGQRAAERAIELDANNVGAYRNVAAAAQERGHLDVAEAAYANAIRLLSEHVAGGHATPADVETLARTRATAAILLPAVYESAQEVAARRSKLIANIDRLNADGVKLRLDDEPGPTLFMLAYQGREDREVQERFAKLMVAPEIPAVHRARDAGEKIRVGFVSRFFREHTIGRLNQGLIAKLSREDFHVTVFSVGEYRDSVAESIRGSADEYVVLPPVLGAARGRVIEKRPDVLFYTDIGMDPVTYSLAFSRLAPVQCTTWGHPVTSGIPAIDYFISSKVLDVETAQEQYTERLVRPDVPAVYYHRPTLPEQAKSRRDFGFDDDVNLYGCLQMLWKFHPEFDAILAGVLRRDPAGHVLLVAGLSPTWDQHLRERWQRSMPDVADRIMLLPRQSHGDFLALTASCDVMLDPIHFGGGNTSYEAFAFGVPVVTLPFSLLRGRIALAQYSMMGMEDLIARDADHYVELASRVGMDREFRRAMKEKVLERCAVLYENAAAVRGLEEFLGRAVREAMAR